MGGLGFRECAVEFLGFRVWGLGFRGLGFDGLGFREPIILSWDLSRGCKDIPGVVGLGLGVRGPKDM